LNEKRRLVRVLWGLHTCHLNAGELRTALELSREMGQIAESLASAPAIVESLHALGTTLAFMGRCPEAREALERIFDLLPVGGHESRAPLSILDPCVTSLGMLSRLLALMGYLDDAVDKAVTAASIAKELTHPPSLAYATFWVGWIRHASGDHVEACRQLQSAMDLSRAYCLPQFVEWGRVVRGSSLAQLGKASEGIAEMRKSLDAQVSMRCHLERPYCLTLLAEALVADGNPREALEICDEALSLTGRTEGRSYESETHRIRGEALQASGFAGVLQVQQEFQQALEIARQQQCRLLELRAAMSQYQFCRRLDGGSKEHMILAGLIDWFAHSPNATWVAKARKVLADYS